MRAWKRILALGLLAAGLILPGCGGDEEGKPIPAATATALNSQLDNIQARLNNGSAGACKDILEGPREPNMEQVGQLIDDMPDDVDSDVRSALEDSFDHLWDLVGDECDQRASDEDKARQEREQQQDTNTDTDTDTTPTDTTPTDTTPTDTTPTDTTPTTPDEEPLPPEGDGDNGGQLPGNSGGGAGADGGAGGGAGAEGL